MTLKTGLLKTAISTAAAASIATAATARNLDPAGDAETAKVISVVSSIPLAVDLTAYDLAAKAFAPSIVIDYTSVWGGEPSTMTPAQLMTSWRGLVPGFDGTWHQLSDVTAEVNGDTANATAFVDGRHWIGDQLWRPIGTYAWKLAKKDGQWRVTHMTFNMTQELGDRALTAQAMDRVKAKTAK